MKRPRTVRHAGACGAPDCKAKEKHRHPVCQSCGSVRYRGPACVTCANHQANMATHRETLRNALKVAL